MSNKKFYTENNSIISLTFRVVLFSAVSYPDIYFYNDILTENLNKHQWQNNFRIKYYIWMIIYLLWQ